MSSARKENRRASFFSPSCSLRCSAFRSPLLRLESIVLPLVPNPAEGLSLRKVLVEGRGQIVPRSRFLRNATSQGNNTCNKRTSFVTRRSYWRFHFVNLAYSLILSRVAVRAFRQPETHLARSLQRQL